MDEFAYPTYLRQHAGNGGHIGKCLVYSNIYVLHYREFVGSVLKGFI
jgi:hypothetical protein